MSIIFNGEGACLHIKLCCEQRSVQRTVAEAICACAKRVKFIYTCSNVGELTIKGGEIP